MSQIFSKGDIPFDFEEPFLVKVRVEFACPSLRIIEDAVPPAWESKFAAPFVTEGFKKISLAVERCEACDNRHEIDDGFRPDSGNGSRADVFDLQHGIAQRALYADASRSAINPHSGSGETSSKRRFAIRDCIESPTNYTIREPASLAAATIRSAVRTAANPACASTVGRRPDCTADRKSSICSLSGSPSPTCNGSDCTRLR